MTDSRPSSVTWKTSSASGGTNCVEVAFVTDAVLVRDSKNRSGAVLRLSKGVWRDFITAQKSSEPRGRYMREI
jgi:hypothetical protein